MKITLSKSHWEAIGKKAGWRVSQTGPFSDFSLGPKDAPNQQKLELTKLIQRLVSSPHAKPGYDTYERLNVLLEYYNIDKDNISEGINALDDRRLRFAIDSFKRFDGSLEFKNEKNNPKYNVGDDFSVSPGDQVVLSDGSRGWMLQGGWFTDEKGSKQGWSLSHGPAIVAAKPEDDGWWYVIRPQDESENIPYMVVRIYKAKSIN